jgi:hypothetical protein
VKGQGNFTLILQSSRRQERKMKLKHGTAIYMMCDKITTLSPEEQLED